MGIQDKIKWLKDGSNWMTNPNGMITMLEEVGAHIESITITNGELGGSLDILKGEYGEQDVRLANQMIDIAELKAIIEQLKATLAEYRDILDARADDIAKLEKALFETNKMGCDACPSKEHEIEVLRLALKITATRRFEAAWQITGDLSGREESKIQQQVLNFIDQAEAELETP